MFEVEQLKPLVFGFLLGGGSGFLLHKNLKISKGLGIGLGGVLGIVVAYQILKSQAPEKQKKMEEGLRKKNECMKKHNIGQPIDNSKMSKEEFILAIKENEKNAQKYGALCNSYMVKG